MITFITYIYQLFIWENKRLLEKYNSTKFDIIIDMKRFKAIILSYSKITDTFRDN
jgi:hypothetical protein